jgi:hypothetical protein
MFLCVACLILLQLHKHFKVFVIIFPLSQRYVDQLHHFFLADRLKDLQKKNMTWARIGLPSAALLSKSIRFSYGRQHGSTSVARVLKETVNNGECINAYYKETVEC